MGIKILSSAYSVPALCLNNDELAALKNIDTNDEWIKTRTGISERRLSVNELTSDLGADAAKKAIKNAGIKAEDLECIIVATFTSENFTPSCACVIQDKLGLSDKPMIMAFDINAACSGFIYALTVANGLLSSGHVKNVCVIGSDRVTSVTNWEDRSTCVLFGDGAGAMIIEKDDSKETHLYTAAQGDASGIIQAEAFPEYVPVHMEGQTVFRFATKSMMEGIQKVLDASGYTLDDIDWIVPHQANKRILDYVIKKSKIDPSKVYSNIDHFGNTSAATVPIGFAELDERGDIKPGMKIILVAFGGGFAWASALLEI